MRSLKLIFKIYSIVEISNRVLTEGTGSWVCGNRDTSLIHWHLDPGDFGNTQLTQVLQKWMPTFQYGQLGYHTGGGLVPGKAKWPCNGKPTRRVREWRRPSIEGQLIGSRYGLFEPHTCILIFLSSVKSMNFSETEGVHKAGSEKGEKITSM